MKKNYHANSKKLRILRIFLALLLVLTMLPLNVGATSGDSKITANTEENIDESNTEDVSKNSKDNSDDGEESAVESDETPSTDAIPEENTTENNASKDTAEDETETDIDTDTDTADDSSAAPIRQARDGTGLNSADNLYLDVDVRFQITDGQEQVVFVADVNKGREALDLYVLTPSFSGDANVSPSDYSVEVYKINLDGTYSLADPSEYSYNNSTGEITFTDIASCYAVRYTLDTIESFVSADMSTGSGVAVEATFDVAITAGSSTKTLSDTHYFQPITAVSPNDTLNNSSIITGYDVTDQTETSIDVVFQWALDVGLVDSDGNPLALDVSAGNYFVFTIDSDVVQFYNDGGGILTRSDGTEVGVFYYYTDSNNNGTLILVFNNYTENHDNITGEITVTSGFTGTVGDDVEINISTNNDTVIDEPKDAEYGLDKSGVLEDSDTILWSINVNTGQEDLENLTVTDTQVLSSSGTGWVFIDPGVDSDSIVVYKLDSNGNKVGSSLTLGTDYEASLVDGQWTIELGDTSDAYVIELKAEVRDPSNPSSSYFIYENTAYSDADGFNQLDVTASLRKDIASISKSSSVSTDISTNKATTTWTLLYNSNYTTQKADSVVITDELTEPYWYYINDSGAQAWMQDISFTIDPNSFIVTLTTGNSVTTLDPSDYSISFSAAGDGFEITFPDGSIAIDSDGNIVGEIMIEYKTIADLSDMPEGAAGWRFRNTASTDQGYSDTDDSNSSGIVKSADSINYTEQTVTWSIELNGNDSQLADLAEVYEVLPEGFTIVEGSLAITNTNGQVEVVTTGGGSASAEYFEVDYDPQSTTIGSSTSINYGAGGGFKLIYHKAGGSTDTFVITFKTSYKYDPGKLNEAGYVNSRTNINDAYLVMNNTVSQARASVTLNSRFDNGGAKIGTFIPGTTDSSTGVTANSKIRWTIYANDLNTDISGGKFTDVLQTGLDEEGGTALSNGGTQAFELNGDINLSDVKIYPYTYNGTTRNINYSTELWNYLNVNNCISVTQNSEGNSVLKITFPSSYKTDLEEDLGILTGTDDNLKEANMRFAVVINATLTNPLAAYYPNEASLVKDDTTIGTWTASVSVSAASNPFSKTGEILSDGSTVNYRIVLNKNMDTLTGVEIYDSLMYDSEQQLIFLESDAGNPTGYALKVYKAYLTTAGEYETGEEIDAGNYTVEYAQNDLSNQGFTVKFNNTYEITTPVIIQYSAVIIDGYFKPGDTITNSAEMKGYDRANSEWDDRYYYTNVSGSSTGTATAFTIRKVYTDADGNEYSLSGAAFYLYSSSKRYITNSGSVDENGEILFDPVITGTYYLVEAPPEGYVTDYDKLENALQLQVTVTNDQVTVSKRNDDGSMEEISDEDGVITINNDTVTGSFKLTKYKKDSEGNNTVNPLANAEFVLYKKLDDGTILYYSKKDANGTCLFEAASIDDAVVLVSDENGTIEESGIIEGEYYLQEIAAPVGYLALEDEVTINVPVEDVYDVDLYDDMHLTDISGTKTWDDSGFEEYRPESISVNLFRKTEGLTIPEKVASQEVTPDSEGNWNYSFSNLPVADENGNYYFYTVDEEKVANYEAVSDGNDIVNTFNPDVGSFKIIKYKNDMSGSSTKNTLANAKFVLYKLNGETKAYYSGKNDNGICIFNSESVDDAIVLVSNENGVIEESGLIAGEYYLEEIEAPEGYLPLAVPVSITISVDDVYAADLYDDLELIDISGTKTWDDSDYEKYRPDSITVNLYRESEDTEDAELVTSQKVTADSEGNWLYTFSGLPKVDDNGNLYKYTISEEGLDAYNTEIIGNDITNTIKTIGAFKIIKYKNDISGNNTENPLANAKFVFYKLEGNTKVYYSGEDINGIPHFELDYEEAKILVSDENGLIEESGFIEGEYYLEEIEAPVGYLVLEEPVLIIVPANDVYPITLYDNMETTDISGTKTWDDAGYEESRPESITVNLYRTTGGEAEDELVASKEVTADSEGNWNYTFSRLPVVNDDGKEYTYKVSEEEVSGYDAAVEGYDITNTYIPENPNPEVIAISGTKTWDDAGYEENRPESITVNLYRTTEGGTEAELVTSQEVTADAEGNWNYTFSDLPSVDDEGNKYNYTVNEEVVSGYDAAVEGYDITNTYIPENPNPEVIAISGTKTWDDAGYEEHRPESITVNLYRTTEGGTEAELVTSQEVTSDAEGNWNYTFSDLPSVDDEGNKYNYTVNEEVVSGYDAAVEGYDITNTYIPENPNPEVIAISGTKTWDDAGYEENRPESITVNLYRTTEGGTEAELVTSQEVTADAEGNWNYTFSDLPSVDDEGNKYNYTVNEEVVSGYDAAVEGYDITNTYIPENPNPEVIAISGTKTWDDAGYEEHRPESITVNLYRMPEDGAETELVTSQEVAADSEGNWRYTFSDLPMADDNGKLYTYTVSEKEVSGYEAAVEGYDITNTYKPDSDKDKTPNDTTKKGTTKKTTKNATNAKTGDFVNLILLWGILIASAGICGYALWRKFRKLKK